jgi:molybdate transport system permease protein
VQSSFAPWAPVGRSSAAQRFHLRIARKAAESLLRKGELAVHRDLEDAVVAFDETDFGAVLFHQLIPRTEGPRFVASPHAVFDRDLHRRHLAAIRTSQPTTPAAPLPDRGAVDRPAPVRLAQFTPDEIAAIRLSLRVALWAMLCSLPAALPTALLLARGRFWGKSLVDGAVHLPLVMPPVVTGYVLLLLFGREGPLGRLFAEAFGLVFAFRWTGAALASAIMGFPLMVRAIRLSIEAVDRRLEEAAGTLGASRPLVFLLVTLPLIAPGIAAGMVLSFARSLGEFGATITFVSNIPGETQTLPLAIYSLTQVPAGDAAALRLTAVSVLVSMAALVVSESLARRLGRRLQGE